VTARLFRGLMMFLIPPPYNLLCLTTTLSYPQPVDNFRTERIGPAGEKLKNTKTGPRPKGMSLSSTVVERSATTTSLMLLASLVGPDSDYLPIGKQELNVFLILVHKGRKQIKELLRAVPTYAPRLNTTVGERHIKEAVVITH